MPAEDVLTLTNVGFAYPKGGPVIADISLSVPRGTILGIVGPSGCGKSTLLGMLAGLRTPTTGSVQRRFRGDQHPTTMVFQTDTLSPWLTVKDNARYFTKFRAFRRLFRSGSGGRRERRKGVDERIDHLLDMVHLKDYVGLYPYQLSGGMRRRLQFVAGIAPQPEVLLLDEPFSAVDEPTRVALHQDVSDVVRALGTTTILVTHDLAEAVTLCDKVVILSNRPATVAAVHDIPFGVKRDILGIRGSQEFLDLYGRLWDELSEQIRATPRETADGRKS